jgi:hypothetical protein
MSTLRSSAGTFGQAIVISSIMLQIRTDLSP